MKKNDYSIIIFNSHTQYNKSIIISRLQIYCIAMVALLIISYTIFTSYILYFSHDYQKIEQNIISESLNGLSFVPPIKGFVTKAITENHNGIDIACESGENIKSISDGIIIFANKLPDYGLTIIIAHSKNVFSKYSHLKKIDVKEKDIISMGQIIGQTGESGDLSTAGPHLHFEIWQNDSIIDPREIIKEYREMDVSVKN